MTYADYLRMNGYEDSKETYVDFLFGFVGLSEDEATQTANMFY